MALLRMWCVYLLAVLVAVVVGLAIWLRTQSDELESPLAPAVVVHSAPPEQAPVDTGGAGPVARPARSIGADWSTPITCLT